MPRNRAALERRPVEHRRAGALPRWGRLRYEQAMVRNPSEPRSGKAQPSRQERLAEALRANLRRRKAQRRARSNSEETGHSRRQDEADRH
jgi:hypothetical protein